MPIEGTGYQRKGDGLHSGDRSQVSLSSQTSSSGESYCAGRANGSKMYRVCDTGFQILREKIVRENPVCDRCIRSVWRS